MFIITKEWLEANGTLKMAWTRAQLAILRVQWPPKTGWKRQLVATRREITDGEKYTFEQLGVARQQTLAKSALLDWAESVPAGRERPF